MRRTILFFLFLFLLGGAKSQLMVNMQYPPVGLLYKPQLWSMVITNTSNASINLHIEVVLTESASGSQVLSGVTRVIPLAPGTTQINASSLLPIQYNVLNNSYNIDANPFGMLPIGSFDACYTFIKHFADYTQEIAEHCQEIFIEPLGPPELIYPYDQTAIEELHPNLVWLPPVPVQQFANLTYELKLVEMIGTQSASDAIDLNPALYQQNNISTNTLLYPQSAPSLEFNKKYAWRIGAKNNNSVVGYSQVWEFTLKQFGKADSTKTGNPPFVSLKKENDAGYAIFVGRLRIDYLNETSDSAWNYKITDLSTENKNRVYISIDTVPLIRGHNLISIDVTGSASFVDKHIYLFEIVNSRNESYRLLFEYRKPEETYQN